MKKYPHFISNKKNQSEKSPLSFLKISRNHSGKASYGRSVNDRWIAFTTVWERILPIQTQYDHTQSNEYFFGTQPPYMIVRNRN